MAHSLAEAESYLVVRLGALGDALRVCPAVRRLRRERPNARIAWAVEHWVHPLLAHSRDVDRFHILDRRALRAGGRTALREMRRFAGEVRSARYEVALDFHGRAKSGFVTRSSGARWRLGYPSGQSTEMNHLFTNVHVRLDDPAENRVLRFLHLLEPLRISTDYDPADLGLPIEPGAIESASEWYECAGRPEVAIFAGSSMSQSAYHRWPAVHWAKLLNQLGDQGIRSMAFWGPDEEMFTREIVARAGPSCRLSPSTRLPEMMAMLGRFSAFIGSNTAAAHMAWMQGVPTAMFTGVAELRTDAPLAPVRSRTLRADDKVRIGASKRRQPEVVSAVPVDAAYRAVCELLEAT